MSAQSRIIALGKFSEDVRPYLNYDVGELVEPGEDVVITLLECNSTAESRDVAMHFGMRELLDLHNAVKKDLPKEFVDYVIEQRNAFTIETMFKLRERYFTFIFLPEA